jgi:hypothetical protein
MMKIKLLIWFFFCRLLRKDGKVEDLGDFTDFYMQPDPRMNPDECSELQKLQDEVCLLMLPATEIPFLLADFGKENLIIAVVKYCYYYVVNLCHNSFDFSIKYFWKTIIINNCKYFFIRCLFYIIILVVNLS